MEIRRPRIDEFDKLKRIHKSFESEFEFPDLAFLSSIYVIESEGEIVGFGAVQPIFEAVLVLDQTKSVDERLMALDMLQARAESEFGSQGVKQIHAFCQNNSFTNLLKKRFGYKNTKGKALVKVI